MCTNLLCFDLTTGFFDSHFLVFCTPAVPVLSFLDTIVTRISGGLTP